MKKAQTEFQTFLNLDIRVGKIVNAETLPHSAKLLRLTVDLGPDYETVTILTGMAKYYSPQDFTGKSMLFLANLPPRPMAGETSQGMLLSAEGSEGKPILIEAPPELSAGSVII